MLLFELDQAISTTDQLDLVTQLVDGMPDTVPVISKSPAPLIFIQV